MSMCCRQNWEIGGAAPCEVGVAQGRVSFTLALRWRITTVIVRFSNKRLNYTLTVAI